MFFVLDLTLNQRSGACAQKAGPELKIVFIDSEMKFAMTESHFLSYNY